MLDDGARDAEPPATQPTQGDPRAARGWFRAGYLFDSVFLCHERRGGGGLRFTDIEYLQLQRDAAWDVVVRWGSNVMEGHNVLAVRFPIEVFEPRTSLERLMFGFCFAPMYLERAARVPPGPQQLVERMKEVICFAVAGLHLTPTQRMPFNSLLGETFQARLDDGTRMFAEQVHHSPHIARWDIQAHDGSYRMYGQVKWSVSGRPSGLRSRHRGLCHVEFADGGHITFTLPTVVVSGLMFGDRVIELADQMSFRCVSACHARSRRRDRIERGADGLLACAHARSRRRRDATNGLECDLRFNPDGNRWWLRRLWSRLRGAGRGYKRDQVVGHIVRASGDQAVLCTVDGSWLSHLDFDGERRWQLGREQPSSITPDADQLPSASHCRPDLRALVEGDLERAEELKALMEEKERYAARLRRLGAEQREQQQRQRQRHKKMPCTTDDSSAGAGIMAAPPAALHGVGEEGTLTGAGTATPPSTASFERSGSNASLASVASVAARSFVSEESV